MCWSSQLFLFMKTIPVVCDAEWQKTRNAFKLTLFITPGLANIYTFSYCPAL